MENFEESRPTNGLADANGQERSWDNWLNRFEIGSLIGNIFLINIDLDSPKNVAFKAEIRKNIIPVQECIFPIEKRHFKEKIHFSVLKS